MSKQVRCYVNMTSTAKHAWHQRLQEEGIAVTQSKKYKWNFQKVVDNMGESRGSSGLHPLSLSPSLPLPLSPFLPLFLRFLSLLCSALLFSTLLYSIYSTLG